MLPCDIKGTDGAYHCPYKDTYDGYKSEMCREMCDVDVEENPTAEYDGGD